MSDGLLLDVSSKGTRSDSRSTPFRVFLGLGKNPGVGCTLAEGGHIYYRSLGFGICHTFYNKSGASAYAQSEVNTYVDGAASLDIFPYVDIWYHDYEGTYYQFSTSDYATCVADVNTMLGWANTRFATHGVTRPYLGVYSSNGAAGATKGPTVTTTSYWSDSVGQRISRRADNLACADIQSAYDAIYPEIYTYRLDQFAMKAEIFCQEKAAVGGSAKLIPTFQPTISGVSCTAEQMYNVLKYAYSLPEMDGLFLWSFFLDPSPAPTYYDDQDWMIGAQNFMTDYGISRGDPF